MSGENLYEDLALLNQEIEISIRNNQRDIYGYIGDSSIGLKMIWKFMTEA